MKTSDVSNKTNEYWYRITGRKCYYAEWELNWIILEKTEIKQNTTLVTSLIFKISKYFKWLSQLYQRKSQSWYLLFYYFLLLDTPPKKQSKTTAVAVQPKPAQIKGAASFPIEQPAAAAASMLTQICIRPLTFRTCLN